MIKRNDREACLEELRGLLAQRGLLSDAEELVVEMLEDLTHFAYFTGCITRKEVRRFLGVTEEQTRAIIRSWKQWDEGNRHCGLTRNPFAEEWRVAKKSREKTN
jgi:hypothetical protein